MLVTGGPAEAEAWDPATKTFGPAGALPSARWWGTATLLGDGRVLVIGGFAGDGYPDDGATVADALLWDPAAATFAVAGSLATSRSMHSATLLPDGRVLVVGGVTSTPDRSTLRSSELWDPSTLTFSPGPDLAAASSRPHGHGASATAAW